VAVLQAASEAIERDGRGPIVMVGHSTSLAVNALLEGDLPRVGLIGIGRAPDLGPARKRTEITRLPLAPGRVLEPVYRFVDATGGLDRGRIDGLLDELVAAGVRSLAISEAFAVDDPSGELAVLEAAAARGLPACAGHQLTGALGLELRTVSALVNAAILPRAQATARVVSEGLAAAGVRAPLVILRGDGGATDLAGFAALPLRSLFSGPAASVAGALHYLSLQDGVMLEVGGTSTNIALVTGRRPRLSYVRVGEYATCLRALDVWVAGVAGGSLARVRGRRIVAVGPRSAHIAGLRYASFASPAELTDARATLIAPLPGDPADHLVVDAAGGRYALTVTCAANATDQVEPGSYAVGNPESARLAFAAAGQLLGQEPRELAEQILRIAVTELARPLRAAAAAAGADLRRLSIVGVGGGSGAIVGALARSLGRPGAVAANAEILSSIGAAMSLIQAVEERSAGVADEQTLRAAIEAAEAAAVAAGAAPATIETTTEHDPVRGTIRAVATGALPLEAGADASAEPLDETTLGRRAADVLGLPPERVEEVARTTHYRAYAGPEERGRRRWLLLDRRGAIAHAGTARAILVGRGEAFAAEAIERVRRAERHLGPASIAPPVVVVAGRRVVDCSPLTNLHSVLRTVEAELRDDCGSQPTGRDDPPGTTGGQARTDWLRVVVIEDEGER
jgi:N-methylhydantoinase A/oxoprolinase/acetone carboxylase beta subunit